MFQKQLKRFHPNKFISLQLCEYFNLGINFRNDQQILFQDETLSTASIPMNPFLKISTPRSFICQEDFQIISHASKNIPKLH